MILVKKRFPKMKRKLACFTAICLCDALHFYSYLVKSLLFDKPGTC